MIASQARQDVNYKAIFNYKIINLLTMHVILQKGWKLGTMYRAQPGHPSF